MAQVKISYSAIATQKSEYEKAAKNMRQVMDSIKQINSSLGNDRMLSGAKDALTKLYSLLDTRATALEMLTKALGEATSSYQGQVSKAVKKSNDFKAHKRDFYKNPVTVTAASSASAASASASAAGAGSVAASASVSTSTATTTTSNTTTNVTYNTVVNVGTDAVSAGAGTNASGMMGDTATGGAGMASAGNTGTAQFLDEAPALSGGEFGNVSDVASLLTLDEDALSAGGSAVAAAGLGAAGLAGAKVIKDRVLDPNSEAGQARRERKELDKKLKEAKQKLKELEKEAGV